MNMFKVKLLALKLADQGSVCHPRPKLKEKSIDESNRKAILQEKTVTWQEDWWAITTVL